MYHNRIWSNTTIEQFMDELDFYIRWYNEERIKMSPGGLSPVELVMAQYLFNEKTLAAKLRKG